MLAEQGAGRPSSVRALFRTAGVRAVARLRRSRLLSFRYRWFQRWNLQFAKVDRDHGKKERLQPSGVVTNSRSGSVQKGLWRGRS